MLQDLLWRWRHTPEGTDDAENQFGPSVVYTGAEYEAAVLALERGLPTTR